MTEGEQSSSGSIRSAVVAGVVSVISAIVGAGAVLGAQWMQGKRDLSAQCLARVDKREELLRAKAEAFLVAMSDELAFFKRHDEFEVALARDRLAEMQKAVFALSAYASAGLSAKSLTIVSASESAIVPSDKSDFRESLLKVLDATSTWHSAYQNELQTLQRERAECGGSG